MPYILLSEIAHEKYADKLQSLGFAPIPLPAHGRLNKSVASHADTLIYTDGTVHIANSEYIKELPKEVRSFITGVPEYPSGDYPTDTIFNALLIGNLLFARKASLSETLKLSAKASGYTIINVKQGYAKCSTLAFSKENAAITADSGMAKSMEQHGVRVLKISPGHISLPGCEYGFIGGASFIDERTRTVYFLGDIAKHPDAEDIISFIKEIGHSVHSLDGELTDFGSAVII